MTQFQYVLIIFLLQRDLPQTKEGLSYVHLHISQCDGVLINIIYAPANVSTPKFVNYAVIPENRNL